MEYGTVPDRTRQLLLSVERAQQAWSQVAAAGPAQGLVAVTACSSAVLYTDASGLMAVGTRLNLSGRYLILAARTVVP